MGEKRPSGPWALPGSGCAAPPATAVAADRGSAASRATSGSTPSAARGRRASGGAAASVRDEQSRGLRSPQGNVKVSVGHGGLGGSWSDRIVRHRGLLRRDVNGAMPRGSPRRPRARPASGGTVCRGHRHVIPSCNVASPPLAPPPPLVLACRPRPQRGRGGGAALARGIWREQERAARLPGRHVRLRVVAAPPGGTPVDQGPR